MKTKYTNSETMKINGIIKTNKAIYHHGCYLQLF